jgi:hypothetical protein
MLAVNSNAFPPSRQDLVRRALLLAAMFPLPFIQVFRRHAGPWPAVLVVFCLLAFGALVLVSYRNTPLSGGAPSEAWQRWKPFVDHMMTSLWVGQLLIDSILDLQRGWGRLFAGAFLAITLSSLAYAAIALRRAWWDPSAHFV